MAPKLRQRLGVRRLIALTGESDGGHIYAKLNSLTYGWRDRNTLFKRSCGRPISLSLELVMLLSHPSWLALHRPDRARAEIGPGREYA